MYDNQDLAIKHLVEENTKLKRQIAKLNDEKAALREEYLNYMEYSEITILDLAVEIKNLKGIDNTMSSEEFQQLFKECRLNESDYYSS